MLAIEIGDPRLDAGCRWRQAGGPRELSLEALVGAGELQREIDLETDVVEGDGGDENGGKDAGEGGEAKGGEAKASGGSPNGAPVPTASPLPLRPFLDWSLAAVLTWLEGGSLPQTVGASIHYLKGRELYCDAEEEAIAAGDDDLEEDEDDEGVGGEGSSGVAVSRGEKASPGGEAATEVFLSPLEISRLKRRVLACSVAAIRGLVTVCHDVITSGLVADVRIEKGEKAKRRNGNPHVPLAQGRNPLAFHTS